ncbi:DUF2157 domain-containing protein [Nocardia otitidiscaviarum]|uniref:DUF2157 domain-containing protein n=1 Tax=Nocardia otitidiscaviarum TaxID=1823 RepID=A0A516NRM1_9NOCA|nr:DUF2157 domain-containing protein [Nocardia otitidiscaviarum]MCP9620720.1 DUF2157 domain-containing protein [Nocardia otitidiscaviarum]QDP81531.1 DUF2157 domain-containing protein [Nocardia otitidiscaviarum]
MTRRWVGTALDRLVDDGVLTTEQRTAVATALAEERAAPVPWPRLVAEIAAYVGAGLLLGGILLLLDSSWDDLDRLGQLLVLAVVSIGLAVGGVLLAGGPAALFVRDDGDRSVAARLAAVLFVLTALCVAALVGLALDDAGDDTTWVWAMLAALIVGLAGYAALPSVVGLLACGVFAASAVAGVCGEFLGTDSVGTGVALVALGGIWFAAGRFGVAAPNWVAYVIAIATALIGAQVAGFVHERWSYPLALSVAVVCFGVYATERTPVLVVGGVLAVAVGTTQAVWDWTGQAAATAVTVLVLGALLLGVGAMALTRKRS